jgi:hypothetical protein
MQPIYGLMHKAIYVVPTNLITMLRYVCDSVKHTIWHILVLDSEYNEIKSDSVSPTVV